MAEQLNRKIGEMGYEKLIAGIYPQAVKASGILASTGTEATYPRGTVMAKSTDSGKLYILGSTPTGGDTLTPDCVLCDDTAVEAADDTVTVVYTAGHFNIDALITADGYDLTEADRDKLKERGIYISQILD